MKAAVPDQNLAVQVQWLVLGRPTMARPLIRLQEWRRFRNRRTPRGALYSRDWSGALMLFQTVGG